MGKKKQQWKAEPAQTAPTAWTKSTTAPSTQMAKTK
jgi:hypothetical protein